LIAFDIRKLLRQLIDAAAVTGGGCGVVESLGAGVL
jgi:hypothetical protein